MFNRHALGVGSASEGLTHVHTIEYSFAGCRTGLVFPTLPIRLAQIRSAGTGRVTTNASIALKTLTLRSMVSADTVSAFTTRLSETNVDAIPDVFIRENTLLVVRALVVSIAQMFRWFLTASDGIANKTGQTFADCLMASSHAMGVQTAPHIQTNIGTVFEPVLHSPTGLGVRTTGIVSTAHL